MLDHLDYAATALLIMDYQPALLGFLSEPAPMVVQAALAAQAVRSKGGTMGFVRVAFTDADYDAFPVGSMMGNRVKANRPALDADSPTSAIHGGITA